MKNILKEEKEKKEKDIIKIKKKQEIAKRVRHYSNEVRDLYKPKVSTKKKFELKMLIKQQESHNRPPEVIYRRATKSKMSMSAIRKSDYNSTNQDSDEGFDEYRKAQYSTKPAKINWKKMKNPMVPKKPRPKPEPIVDDYLLRKRINRENREREEAEIGMKQKKFSHNWQKVNVEELTHVDNINLIREKAKAIEKESEMKMQQSTAQGEDIVDNSEANDLLINATQQNLL